MKTRTNNWFDPVARTLWYGLDIYIDGRWLRMKHGQGFDWSKRPPHPDWDDLPIVIYASEAQRDDARKKLQKIRIKS